MPGHKMFKGNGTKSSVHERVHIHNTALEAWYYASRQEEAKRRSEAIEAERRRDELELAKETKREQTVALRMTIRALVENGFCMAAIAEGLGVPYPFVYYSWVRWRPPRDAMTYDLFCRWTPKPGGL